jgi:hypothetical protein
VAFRDSDGMPEPLFPAGGYEQRLADMAARAALAAAGLDAMTAAGADAVTAAMRFARHHYASGGLVPQAAMSQAVNSTPYAEHVQQPAEDEPATAPGSVTGYRWWTLPAPDWEARPSRAEAEWPHRLLRGMRDDWHPGVNTALCKPPGGAHHPPHDAPAAGCYCGFWALWLPQEHPAVSAAGAVPVFGVIKGWGRFREGEHGFRVQKARILALHPKFTLEPYADAAPALLPADYPGRLPPGWHEVQLHVRRRPGVRARTLPDGREVLLPDSVTDAQIEAAFMNAEAWMAVFGDRLAVDYGVPVFQTRNALLAEFPPDPLYAPEPCRHCAGAGTGILTGHAPGCPGYRRSA